MVIGVARPSAEELARCVHHFIGFISVEERYTAGQFAADARKLLAELFQNHDAVIVVGGSMLHMDALLYGIDDLPGDVSVKSQLQEEYRSIGLNALLEELKQCDPTYYNEVDKQNPHRVMRALEVFRLTNKSFSSLRTGNSETLPYRIVHVFLNGEREWVYERINQRVYQMMTSGLIEEVQSLIPYRSLQALNTVGYKEVFEYFDGMISYDECVSLIQQHSRQYAKRQMTWYRNKPSIKEINMQESSAVQGIIDACS